MGGWIGGLMDCWIDGFVSAVASLWRDKPLRSRRFVFSGLRREGWSDEFVDGWIIFHFCASFSRTPSAIGRLMGKESIDNTFELGNRGVGAGSFQRQAM